MTDDRNLGPGGGGPNISLVSELRSIADRLNRVFNDGSNSTIDVPFQALLGACEEVGRSSSGSWLGYHSQIYYRDFQPPPAGARFSITWGLMQAFSNPTTGDWVEYTSEQVIAAIEELAGHPDITALQAYKKAADASIDNERSSVQSILTTVLESTPDTLLTEILEEVRRTHPLGQELATQLQRPSGPFSSRDQVALDGGFLAPTFAVYRGGVIAMRDPGLRCGELANLASRAADHIERRVEVAVPSASPGDRVFIGHGRSPLWRELKVYLTGLGLEVEEFNRIPPAGFTTVAHLTSMLSNAAFALLVLTAEDDQPDGTSRARENVIHETGLFQGKLGFNKAIVLLEEGCNEFSNIHGLQQIRFPSGSVASKFDEVRDVLVREELLSAESGE